MPILSIIGSLEMIQYKIEPNLSPGYNAGNGPPSKEAPVILSNQ